MSKYVVFVTEDEEAWEAKTDAERQEVYDADGRFCSASSSAAAARSSAAPSWAPDADVDHAGARAR